MDLKKIPKDVQRLISASAYINTFTRAIEELVKRIQIYLNFFNESVIVMNKYVVLKSSSIIV